MTDAVVEPRFALAVAAIDAVNEEDARSLTVPDREGEPAHVEPKALAEGRLAMAWIERLRPDADEALRLAARAHHLRRWAIPRDAEPAGRAGYLRWRRRLKEVHAESVAPLLAAAGYDTATIRRVQDLVRKHDLKTDRDTQSLEDAICLVFLETQLDDFARQTADDEKIVDVIRKTLPKMTDDGRRLALTLELPSGARALVERAVG